MFFDMDDEIFLENPEFYHIVSRELMGLGASLSPGAVRDVPTHTEDGIPIRKLYVSNLPPKTTRTELFGLFAQYGFIKSCWMRIGERGAAKDPTPNYAFVTFSDPNDARKALQAPIHERHLRGRQLKVSPADSWHQPIHDSTGHMCWKVRSNHYVQSAVEVGESSGAAEGTENVTDTQPGVTENAESSSAADNETNAIEALEEEPLGILDILNRDCLDQILNYVSVLDIVRTERVSKRWQFMVQEHLLSRRTFRTSWWDSTRRTLTTAVFRRLLQKLGNSLSRLHIDNNQLTRTSLNDRTAHIVGKFCPNLEELRVYGMYIKNWNPLIYGCKELKNVKFVSCNKLTDSSMVHLLKNDSNLENLIIANNTHVTGIFLNGGSPAKLNALSLYNCSNLQGTVICKALDHLPHITTLRLDMCPDSMWKIIPSIISKLPRLETLSLTEYTTVDCVHSQNKDFCNAIAKLSELKVLNLSNNIYINDAVVKQVANTCTQLETFNISSCNPRRTYTGVSDESLEMVFNQCKRLSWLDVSYLAALTDHGLTAASGLPLLKTLIARGSRLLTSDAFVNCLYFCPLLREVDMSSCNNVGLEVVRAAVISLDESPRLLSLHVANTLAVNHKLDEIPTHKYLTVNMQEDYCNPHLRPDFIDQIFDDSSEDSFDDVIYDGFLGGNSDDDDYLFMNDDELDDYDGFMFGLPNDIIML